VGIVGFALVIAATLLAFRGTLWRARIFGAPEYYVFCVWFVAALIISIAETTFIDPRDIGLIGAAMVLSCAASHQRFGAASTMRQPAAVPSQTLYVTSPRGRFA
jgi:hypothetical protein